MAKISCKHCYTGHHFLELSNPFRKDKQSFDGSKENERAPLRITRDRVFAKLDGYDCRFGILVDFNPKLLFN